MLAALLVQLKTLLLEAYPAILTIIGGLLIGVLHRNRKLSQANAQLARKVGELANEEIVEDISSIVKKVDADDAKRIALEKSLDDPSDGISHGDGK